MFVFRSLQSTYLNLCHYRVSFQVMCANVALGQWNIRLVKMITVTCFIFGFQTVRLTLLILILHYMLKLYVQYTVAMWQLVPCLCTSSVADKDINHACWMSSCDKKDLSHQIKGQNRGKETCRPEQNQSAYATTGDKNQQNTRALIRVNESRYKTSWCCLSHI